MVEVGGRGSYLRGRGANALHSGDVGVRAVSIQTYVNERHTKRDDLVLFALDLCSNSLLPNIDEYQLGLAAASVLVRKAGCSRPRSLHLTSREQIDASTPGVLGTLRQKKGERTGLQLATLHTRLLV